jgi:hypothetical protein
VHRAVTRIAVVPVASLVHAGRILRLLDDQHHLPAGPASAGWMRICCVPRTLQAGRSGPETGRCSQRWRASGDRTKCSDGLNRPAPALPGGRWGRVRLVYPIDLPSYLFRRAERQSGDVRLSSRGTHPSQAKTPCNRGELQSSQVGGCRNPLSAARGRGVCNLQPH